MLDISKNEERDPEGNSAYLRLSALLLVHTAFESYLNHLGAIVCPVTWKDERNFFTRTPYRGTLGKYRFLAEHLHVPIARGELPYQDLKDLDSWRNFVVHGRDENHGITVRRGPEGIEIKDEMFLFSLNRFAERIRDSIETACNALNSAALEIAPESDLSALGAFEGSLGNGPFWLPKENERDNQQE